MSAIQVTIQLTDYWTTKSLVTEGPVTKSLLYLVSEFLVVNYQALVNHIRRHINCILLINVQLTELKHFLSQYSHILKRKSPTIHLKGLEVFSFFGLEVE